MAVFYHVSPDLKHNGEFIPRVPYNRHEEMEDNKTHRVCVSPSIEGCLTAIPGGGSGFLDLCEEQRGYFLLFRIDTEKLGIPQENIISDEELFQKDLVRDADISKEHWITCPFTVPKEDKIIIKIEDFFEDINDLIPYFIYQLADEKFEGDYLEAYKEYFKKNVPIMTSIIDLKYKTETLKEKEILDLYFKYEDEKEALFLYLNDMEKLKILESDVDTIKIQAKETVNLRKLFLYHASIAG